VTIAKRPSGRAGMGETCHKSEIRKSDIFFRAGIDRVFRCHAQSLAREPGSNLSAVIPGRAKARTRNLSCVRRCGPSGSGSGCWSAARMTGDEQLLAWWEQPPERDGTCRPGSPAFQVPTH
jgi:hypothetical protein